MMKPNMRSARVAKTTGLILLAAILVFLAEPGAFAHGNEQHVIGVVSQVTDAAITVKTVDGPVTVAVGSVTEFAKSGVAAKITDLKVGDRVVIHAMKHGDQLTAHTVHFGVSAPKKPN
jgi:hypothetical protein